MKNSKEKPAVIFSHSVKYFIQAKLKALFSSALQVRGMRNTCSILTMKIKSKNPCLIAKGLLSKLLPLQEFTKGKGRPERTTLCFPSGARGRH